MLAPPNRVLCCICHATTDRNTYADEGWGWQYERDGTFFVCPTCLDELENDPDIDDWE